MLEDITEENTHIFNRLAQDYEEEFSPITGKKKGEDGKHTLDSDWRPPNHGYYWVESGEKVGFCIKGVCDSYSDIAEFYIIPSARGNGIGKQFAFAVFDLFPGPWQVRQIEGANLAKSFWRAVIKDYSKGAFKEEIRDDPYWGKVTCQRFESRKK
ncbi:MAG: hypothetical protein KFB93_04275 [Simkaniaceae bacterium]|nr:MAG: hypothetical protein KFB93_04275 [Simkaniaceae bacterium]